MENLEEKVCICSVSEVLTIVTERAFVENYNSNGNGSNRPVAA